MKISTNPLNAFEQSFEGLALTELKVKSIELIIISATSKFIEVQGKNDSRGYSFEVANRTIKKAHYRTTPLGKFNHLDSLSELLKEMELSKSSAFLSNLVDNITFNPDDKFRSKVTEVFAPLIIPTLVAEILYSIVDNEIIVFNIQDKLINDINDINDVGTIGAFHMSKQTNIESYTDSIISRAIQDSSVSEEIIQDTLDKYNKHKFKIFKKLTSG